MAFSWQRFRDYLQWHRTHWIRLSPEDQQELGNLFRLLVPRQARGKKKIRMGASRDGGYVMIHDFQGINGALSLGIGPDVSWDLDVARRSIPVRQYDHTVDAAPQHHPIFHFSRKRIVSRPSGEGTVTLTSLLEESSGQPLLLKMDIDGAEWEVLDATDFKLLRTCRQIVLELHDFRRIGEIAWRKRAQRVLEKLTADFGVVHAHGNNLSPHLRGRHGWLPDCLEVTLANRHHYILEPTEEIFPGPHDKKNNPFYPDFRLGRFRDYGK